MPTLNTGVLFRKKYESDQNAIRRFLLANEGLTRERYRVLNGNTLNPSSALNLIKALQTPQYWAANAWLHRHEWHPYRSTTYVGRAISSANGCPMCMAEVFHSHFQSFKWVRRCPLHGVELTELCPDCSRPWLDYQSFKPNRCPTCGTVRPMRLEDRRRQIQGHTKAQQRTLGVFWSLRRIDLLFCHVIYLDFVHHGSDAGILTGSQEFPELAVTLFPEHAALLQDVGSPATGLKELQFDGTPVTRADLETMPVNRSISVEFARNAMDAINGEICAALDAVASPDSPPRPTRHVYVDRLDDYNISELAYDAWRAIVYEPGAHVTPQGWWSRMFDLLGYDQPEVPAIVNLVVSNDGASVVDPSDELRGWMYRMQLKTLFIYLYQHAFFLKGILRDDIRNSYSKMRSPRPPILPHRYASFRVRLLPQNRLQIVYRDIPAWTDLLVRPDFARIFDGHNMKSALWNCGLATAKLDTLSDEFARYLIINRANSLYDCISELFRLHLQEPNEGSAWH